MKKTMNKKNYTPRAQTTLDESFEPVLVVCASHLPLSCVFRRVESIHIK